MSIVSKARQVEQLQEDRSSGTVGSRINYGNQFIQIKKNEIHFGQLSKQLKHLFVCSLKQCANRNCLREVFDKWNDECQNKKHVKITFSNEDGAQLIWRMQKVIQRHKMAETGRQLTEKLNELKTAYSSYEESLKNVTQKEKLLADLQLDKESKGSQRKFLMEKMENFQVYVCKKMEGLKEKIKFTESQQDRLRNRQEILFGKGSMMGNILTKAISKQVRHLLRETIVAIVETTHDVVTVGEADEQEVFVVFEQCYSTKRMKKRTIIKYIGSEDYLEKVNKGNAYLSIKQTQLQQSKKVSNLMSCHRCMKICDSGQLKFCNTKTGQMQTNSYSSTDYYTYRKNFLEGDYFDVSEQHVLPFYLYGANEKGKLMCNRAFCSECVTFLFDGKEFACPYCSGLCACTRCEIAMGIVKLMALDYQNDPQEKKCYHGMLRLFGGRAHPDVSQTLKLRLYSNGEELCELIRIWSAANERKSKRLALKIDLKSCQGNNFSDMSGKGTIRWDVIFDNKEESIEHGILMESGQIKENVDRIHDGRNMVVEAAFENGQWMTFLELEEKGDD